MYFKADILEATLDLLNIAKYIIRLIQTPITSIFDIVMFCWYETYPNQILNVITKYTTSSEANNCGHVLQCRNITERILLLFKYYGNDYYYLAFDVIIDCIVIVFCIIVKYVSFKRGFGSGIEVGIMIMIMIIGID